jgi:hypothetical protein
MKCNRSHSPLLLWIYVQFLRRIIWWCWDSTCGIFVVKVWVPILFKQPVNSSKGNQERIQSLEVHRHKIIKFNVCKDLDVKIILVTTFFLSQEDFSNSYWICMPNIRGLHMKKHLPFLLVTEDSYLKLGQILLLRGRAGPPSIHLLSGRGNFGY